MKLLVLISLFLALPMRADSTPNPVERYFGRIPIELAHMSMGTAVVPELSQKSIDVLVWNVKKGEKKFFDGEFSKFARKKDLFLIQEAYTGDYFLDSLKTKIGYHWDFGLSFTYLLYNNEATGNLIGSHAPPSWVQVLHTLDLEPLTATPKTTVFTRYRLRESDQELLVISMHGINFNGLGAFLRHLDQLSAVIAGHQGPVLLAGDFNTRTKERLQELREFAEALGLTEVDFINGELRMTAVGTKNILDHAFVRGLSVRHAEVFDSNGSDHEPMVLKLDVL